jgi:lipopolysaccharide transport system ATP-binding protein
MYDLAMVRPIAEEPAAPAAEAEPVILTCDNVGKSFRRWEAQPFLLRNLLLRLVGRAHKPKEFWPLRNVSFEIRRGETVGLIGTNGSGKSTLLRILAGACFPTEGEIKVRGRIAPLLSLGVGFQPDMTGRECVEINATTLGLHEDEIAAALRPIAEFAELTDFMATPVRYYSSGMMARLAFAIAVHVTPDLMLVDEVLAVGDYAFQKKCAARIAELQDEGVTILIVSHGDGAIRELCSRVLWLKDGRLHRDGPPDAVCDEYLGV